MNKNITSGRDKIFWKGVLTGTVCAVLPAGTLAYPVQGLGIISQLSGLLIYVVAPPLVGVFFLVFVITEKRKTALLGAMLGIVIGALAAIYVLPVFRL